MNRAPRCPGALRGEHQSSHWDRLGLPSSVPAAKAPDYRQPPLRGLNFPVRPCLEISGGAAGRGVGAWTSVAASLRTGTGMSLGHSMPWRANEAATISAKLSIGLLYSCSARLVCDEFPRGNGVGNASPSQGGKPPLHPPRNGWSLYRSGREVTSTLSSPLFFVVTASWKEVLKKLLGCLTYSHQ